MYATANAFVCTLLSVGPCLFTIKIISIRKHVTQLPVVHFVLPIAYCLLILRFRLACYCQGLRAMLFAHPSISPHLQLTFYCQKLKSHVYKLTTRRPNFSFAFSSHVNTLIHLSFIHLFLYCYIYITNLQPHFHFSFCTIHPKQHTKQTFIAYRSF